MATTGPDVTPLDVLDGFFGGTPDLDAIGGLTLTEIDDLGELVVLSAQVLAGEPAAGGGAGDLIYPGGWLARGWGQELFRAELHCSLLYEPRLLLHDPLAEYYFAAFNTLPRMRSIKGATGGVTMDAGPDMWADQGRRVHRGDDLEGARADLARIVRFLLEVEPLLRSGVIVMRSQWPTIRRSQRQLMASTNADLTTPEMIEVASSASAEGGHLPKWDNLRGLGITPPGGFLTPNDPAQWQPEFFYLAKTLAVADAAGAIYSPATPDEARLLMAKSRAAASRRGARPGQPVLEEVLRVLVPDMTLDAATAVKIRQSESAFEDWRRALRDIQRDAASLSDPVELRELVDDRLQPQVTAISTTVSLSQSLRSRSRSMLTTAMLGTLGGLAAGSPLLTSAASAGVPGVAGWLWDAYRGRRPGGASAVIAALLRKDSKG